MKLYNIQSHFLGEWRTIINGVSRDWALGYLNCYKYQAPREAMRVVDSSGKVTEEIAAQTEVAIGIGAGWPSAEQYRSAAARAIAKAEAIELQESKRNKV
jgi:hypothetical protein